MGRPLLHRRNTDSAAFIGAATLHLRPTFENFDATANARLAARLPVVFATSRFAHYLLCMVRDRIGSFVTCDDMQRWLSRWLAQYVGANPDVMIDAEKAQRPFAEAHLEFQEADANQFLGANRATLYLRPHYQIEGLTLAVRLQLQLPAVRP